MKRILFLGLMLMTLGTSSAIAQDDIYYNSEDAKKDAQTYTEPERRANAPQDRYDDGTYQSEYQDNNTVRTDESDEYVDYSDDSYASRFRRFNGPMYGMGYYNSFYNPYWYDPFWGGGWGYTPGWSISIGTGWGYGPYWSSGWGWNTWYGYPGFYSAWNSPYCGWGYGGGYGWGGGYGGYGMGYWNGYYAGVYGAGSGRAINYGPRQSLNGIRNNIGTRPGSVYSGGRSAMPLNGDRRGGLRMAENNDTRSGRATAVREDAIRQGNVIKNEGGRTSRFEGRPQADRPSRGSFFSNGNSQGVRQPGTAPMQNTRPSRSFGQRSEGVGNPGRTYTPRSQNTPSRSFGNSNSGGTRSFGNSGSNRSFNSGSSGGSRSFGSGSSGGGRSFGGSSGGSRSGGRR